MAETVEHRMKFTQNILSLSFSYHFSRIFVGSHQECVYKLMLLGIPHHCFPITDDGVSDLRHHHQWIKERLRIENNINGEDGGQLIMN